MRRRYLNNPEASEAPLDVHEADSQGRPSGVALDRVEFGYSGDAATIRSLSLDISEGEFLTLLGPSGCGKSTILKLIGGLLYPDEGRVLISGRDVTRLPPQRRGISMVFQSFALFPHMSVSANVGFGLRMRGISKDERLRRVRDALATVGLDDFGHRLPHELSGGQQQRVGLARAIIVEPAVLLLDEPLSNLDSQLRYEMAAEVRQLQQRLGLTAIYVTHDQSEALSVSDRLAIIKEGGILEIGDPQSMFRHPSTAYAARMLGHVNVARVRSEAGDQLVFADDVHIPRGEADAPDHFVVIPPHQIRISSAGSPPRSSERLVVTQAELIRVEYRGDLLRHRLRFRDGTELTSESGAEQHNSDLTPGTRVTVSWDASAMHLINSDESS